MRTLRLRNVPDEVAERLERLAAREGVSVTVLALRELSEASRRADDPSLQSALPDLEISPSDLLDGLDEQRHGR